MGWAADGGMKGERRGYVVSKYGGKREPVLSETAVRENSKGGMGQSLEGKIRGGKTCDECKSLTPVSNVRVSDSMGKRRGIVS